MFFSGRFILDLAEFAKTHGHSEVAIIAASGREPADLERQDCFVDYGTITKVYDAIGQTFQDPDFGLHLGEQINLKVTHYLDQLMDSCSTVEEAFQHAISYSRLISDSMNCTLKVDGNQFRVNFELNPDWALQKDYAINQNLNTALICAANSLRRLTMRNHFPVEVNFHYPKPKRIQEHLRLFNCRLNFGTEVSSIVFDKSLLASKSHYSDFGLLAQLKPNADDILGQLPANSTLLTQVKKAMLTNTNPGSFAIGEVAKIMHVTPRTLQRRLKSEQLSFQQIRDEIRLQLVKKMLMTREYNLEEIAYLIGYSESSALVRAFRNWTGMSPKKFQKQENSTDQRLSTTTL